MTKTACLNPSRLVTGFRGVAGEERKSSFVFVFENWPLRARHLRRRRGCK